MGWKFFRSYFGVLTRRNRCGRSFLPRCIVNTQELLLLAALIRSNSAQSPPLHRVEGHQLVRVVRSCIRVVCLLEVRTVVDLQGRSDRAQLGRSLVLELGLLLGGVLGKVGTLGLGRQMFIWGLVVRV